MSGKKTKEETSEKTTTWSAIVANSKALHEGVLTKKMRKLLKKKVKR